MKETIIKDASSLIENKLHKKCKRWINKMNALKEVVLTAVFSDYLAQRKMHWSGLMIFVTFTLYLDLKISQ